jgi:hypothetical protein
MSFLANRTLGNGECSGWLFATAVRTATVMASPVTVALAKRWIVDGTGDAYSARCAANQLSGSGLPPRSCRAPASAPTRLASIYG